MDLRAEEAKSCSGNGMMSWAVKVVERAHHVCSICALYTCMVYKYVYRDVDVGMNNAFVFAYIWNAKTICRLTSKYMEIYAYIQNNLRAHAEKCPDCCFTSSQSFETCKEGEEAVRKNKPPLAEYKLWLCHLLSRSCHSFQRSARQIRAVPQSEQHVACICVKNNTHTHIYIYIYVISFHVT